MLKIDEHSIGIPGLHDLPWPVGTAGKPLPNSPWTRRSQAYLKPDEYILRDYVDRATGATGRIFLWPISNRCRTPTVRTLRSICLPGAGWLVTSSKHRQHPSARAAGRRFREPIHDGESQPTHPGSVLVPKRPGRLGGGISGQAAPVAGPDPVPAIGRQPGAADHSFARHVSRIRSWPTACEFTGHLFPLLAHVLHPSTKP